MTGILTSPAVTVVLLLIAAALLVYLVVALVRPERF
ncbi:K(+)-transporting ATPase subunit F [Nakamurella leprariae]|uniref:K(+)-transporting ATPase subunit F n=1 Tax=Nakamurella leprariae TaxID=2803911 RepID=A0A938YH38_9ACTN|nr:K(+)-transporting ATPase subunit F [Nakamurella leprariae]MBM9468247.1 K(+)-transporting ATPase subunit F [Nakamurella leprariae]